MACKYDFLNHLKSILNTAKTHVRNNNIFQFKKRFIAKITPKVSFQVRYFISNPFCFTSQRKTTTYLCVLASMAAHMTEFAASAAPILLVLLLGALLR